MGIGQAALEAAVWYAKDRTSMGQKLVQLQAIQLKLADMATRLESVRSLYVAGATPFFDTHRWSRVESTTGRC